MRILSAADVEAALDWDSLIERLRQAFRRGAEVPVRHHHEIANPGGPEGTLLLMPAWQSGRHIGVKVVTIFPDNGEQGLPSVMAAYLLLDGKTGSPIALIDGPTLTLKRTAAASALASGYLSRPDCERLLMVGTGALAPYLVSAHAAVRPICNVLIWGRAPDKAAKLAKRLDRADFRVAATEDLEAAAQGADIISCATLSRDPLVRGDWLRPGQHLDLVGAFRPAQAGLHEKSNRERPRGINGRLTRMSYFTKAYKVRQSVTNTSVAATKTAMNCGVCCEVTGT